MITITEAARQKIAKFKEQFTQPVKGLRVSATPRSPFRASFTMKFVADGEPEFPTDIIESVDEIAVYIDRDTAPYLEGAAVDYVYTPMASGFKVVAPPRKLDTPEGSLAVRIQKILDEQVNRSLFLHGGGATLIDVKGRSVFLEMVGGCQGCSHAAATMRDGIAAAIKGQIPEIEEVWDVTEHAEGKNPYFSR